MKKNPTNAALAILFFGAAMVRPALAQDATGVASNANKSVSASTLRYVGGDTRIGIGFDSELDGRAELFQVLQSAADSATLAEVWAARRAGGIKFSRHWFGSETAVNKTFFAVDQGENSVRKLTMGGGQEYQNWYWTTYLSKGLTGARQTGSTTSSATRLTTGSDAGRPFEQDVTTTTVTSVFQRPFEWGIGARIGHFYERPLLRLTAGLDYDTGKFSNRQTTASLTGEKFFEGSGISIALSVETNRRTGQFVTDRGDTRGMATLRYEFGAPPSNFRPSKITRTVVTTERVPDPDWKAPEVKPEPPKSAAADATSLASSNVPSAKDYQETFFDLGGTKLKPKAIKELDQLMSRIEAAKPYAAIKVDITGHTCPTGSDRNNYPLSQKRADAVKGYLVGKGLDANVITTVGKAGKGDSKYPEGKGLGFYHRRADTEVVILKDVKNLPASTAAAVTPAAPAVIATAPMIDRKVSREVIEDAPNPWKERALRNSVPHKTSVDVYRFTQTSATDTLGARRFLNRGPVAANDNVTAACGVDTVFDVLANDTDADGDALTITATSAPGRGFVTVSGNKIVYTARRVPITGSPDIPTCLPGADTFTYTISDGKGGTSTATVNVTVQPPAANLAPIAVDDTFTVGCRASATLDVLANDRDPNGDALRITSVTSPQQGSRISIAADGKSLNLAPAILCFDTDAFSYTISDGRGGTATAKVTLIDP
jgi:outer membrane protein OmpA-like peptidoglycan-associated protein